MSRARLGHIEAKSPTMIDRVLAFESDFENTDTTNEVTDENQSTLVIQLVYASSVICVCLITF